MLQPACEEPDARDYKQAEQYAYRYPEERISFHARHHYNRGRIRRHMLHHVLCPPCLSDEEQRRCFMEIVLLIVAVILLSIT